MVLPGPPLLCKFGNKKQKIKVVIVKFKYFKIPADPGHMLALKKFFAQLPSLGKVLSNKR